MNCDHVIGLIDAGPFADYPPAHLDAAWDHARGCALCGPALEAAAALQSGLAALPRPAAPADLTAIVLARIARLDDAGIADAGARVNREEPKRRWPAWVTAVGGAVAVFAMMLPIAAGTMPDFAPKVVRTSGGLVAIPDTIAGCALLGAGLLVYLAGLFLPVRRRGRAGPSAPSDAC